MCLDWRCAARFVTFFTLFLHHFSHVITLNLCSLTLPIKLLFAAEIYESMDQRNSHYRAGTTIKTFSSTALFTLFQAAFLLLITLAHEGSKTLPEEQKPVVLLLIGCSLIASSVLIFLKSVWKACYKTSKLPRGTTTALVKQQSLVPRILSGFTQP